MAPFDLLDQAAEDKTHASRLLRVEEKPFQSLKQRLLGPQTPFSTYLSQPNSSATTNGNDTPSHNDNAGEAEAQHQKFMMELAKFRESMLFDFASFNSSIARIQFLRAANEKERERYADEKLRIEATAQEVKGGIGELRSKLDHAQQTLKVRKEYDLLADRITKAGLKQRDEQNVAIERLRNEIEELEREKSELGQTWRGRREQLQVVMGEAMRLRRQMRYEREPEEVAAEREAEEERKMMLDVGGEGREGEAGMSNVGTPRAEEGASRQGTPMPEAGTPLRSDEAGTPPVGEDADMEGVLEEGTATPKLTVVVEQSEEMDVT